LKNVTYSCFFFFQIKKKKTEENYKDKAEGDREENTAGQQP